MQAAREMRELVTFCSSLPHCTEDLFGTDSSDMIMMDDSDPVQCYLNNAIRRNRELHESLQRKQVEIMTLKQRNAHLKELIDQAERYAAVLDDLTRQPQNVSAFVPHPAHTHTGADPAPWHPTASCPAWHGPPLEEGVEEPAGTGVRRRLWPDRFGEASGSSPAKTPKMDHETVRSFGSFRGFHVLKATPSVGGDFWREDESLCFKAPIREHGTVRTRAFPHGKTFTSRTPDGACRFLWVPRHD